MKEPNQEEVLLCTPLPTSTSCDELTNVEKNEISLAVDSNKDLTSETEPVSSSLVKDEPVIELDVKNELELTSSTPDKPEDLECLQKRFILRPRKTEPTQEDELKKPKPKCDKTEKRDPIEKAVFEVTDESLDLTLDGDSLIEADVGQAKNESIPNLENDGGNSELLSVVKSDESKSKENSESETRISSASENSSIKSVKKKRRRKDLKWSGKRKRGNGGGGKGELKLQPALAFEWQDVGDSSPPNENPQKKGREFAIPSPSLADISMKPAIPEPTATSLEVAKPNICLCRKKPNVFVSGNYNAGELHCQALDCIDGRIVGCCNAIPTQHVGLFRASERVPYQMLCDIHQQRLCRHNCCPGCGLFCTQGKYLMCKFFHHFHRACAGDTYSMICPHCGDDTTPKCVSVTLHSPKSSTLLPHRRTGRAARISVTRASQSIDENQERGFEASSAVLTLGPELFQSNGLISGLHRDKYNYKSLYNAAQSGDAEKVLKVISCGFNPNHVFEESNHQTALHVAAANGHLSVVHILLQAKAQVNVMDDEQNTPLTVAITAAQNDVVKYLIKCGADLLLKSEDGMTPLHIAAKSGNSIACYHLLNGTHLPPRYIDSLDDGGWTPMVWAAEFNHLDTVKTLLNKGADPFIKDAEQNVALHWAAFGGSSDIVEMFLNDGSDINGVNVHGDTPLHIAARQDKYNCVLLLLARGAKSDIKNKSGELARDCAESPASAVYKAITLNMEISALLSKFQDPTPRIVSNDISRGKEKNQIQCVNGVDDEEQPLDFIYITESCFTSKISVDRTITLLQSCRCYDNCGSETCNCAIISVSNWYDNDGRLKPEFKYSNPPTIFECNQLCLCNRITCRNRVVQNGVSCRFQLFRTENRGWGVKSLNLIPKGTYVCEYIGEIITDSEADQREDDSYLFDLDNRDGETYCIDARRYGNFARFINHMCNANLTPVHVFVEHQDVRFPRIAFFANRDIQANEELGYNYGEKFWVIKWKSFTCTCGAENCMYSERTIKTTLDNYKKKLEETT